MVNRLVSGAVVAALTVIAAAACAPAAPPASPTTAPTGQKPAAAAPATAAPAAAAPTAAPKAPAAPPTKATIKFGGLGGSIDRPLFVGIEKGYYAEQGIDLEITEFRSAADMVPLLATGQLDAGHGSTNPGFFNAILAGVPVKVVSDVTILRDPGQDNSIKNSLWIVLRKDLEGEVRTIKDLKGRGVAINNRGTMNHGQLEKILKDNGLTLDDVRLESVPFPDQIPALANKAVDAVITVEPFITIASTRGVGVPFFDMGKGFPDYPVQYLFYGPDFSTKQADVAKRFMVAYMKSLRYLEDAFRKNVNRDEAVQYFIKHTQQKEAALYDAMGLSYNETDGRVNVSAIETDQEFYIRQGLQKQRVDVKTLVDSSFSQHAVQVLGPYKN